MICGLRLQVDQVGILSTTTHVDEHVLLAVFRRDEEDEDESGDDDQRPKDQEPRREEEVLKLRRFRSQPAATTVPTQETDLFDRRDGLLLWTVEGDRDGSDDAEEAADLAEERQAFFEEDRREDGANDNG